MYSYPVHNTVWGEPRSRSLTSSPSYRMMGMESSSLYSSPANQWMAGHSPSGSLGPSPLSSPRGLHSTYSYPIPISHSPRNHHVGFMDPRLPVFTSHMNPPGQFPGQFPPHLLSASPQAPMPPPMAQPSIHSSLGRARDVRPGNTGVINPTPINATRPKTASVAKESPPAKKTSPPAKKTSPTNAKTGPLRASKPREPSPEALSWHETSASSMLHMVSASPPPAMISASPREPIASPSPRVIEHGLIREPPPSRPSPRGVEDGLIRAPPPSRPALADPPLKSDHRENSASATDSVDSDESVSSDDGIFMPRPDITSQTKNPSKVPLVAPLPLWQLQLNKVDEVLEKYKNLNVGSPRKQSEQQEGRKYQPEEPIRDRSLQVKAVTAPWELGDRGGRRYEPSNQSGMSAPRGVGDATRNAPPVPPSTPQTPLPPSAPGVPSRPSRTDVGPGIVVGRKEGDDAPRVMAIANESPAARSGKIQLDDVLVAVNGITIRDMPTSAISMLLAGPEGTVCSLDLAREGGLPFVVDITRLDSFNLSKDTAKPSAPQAERERTKPRTAMPTMDYTHKPQTSLPTMDNKAYKELEEKRLREAVKDAQKIAPRVPEKHDAVGLSHFSDKAQAEKRLRGEEEDAPKIAPRVPEKDESGGITLVLLEDIELVQGQGKNYELALVTDLAAAVDADAHRFAFVGFEEGQEPRTILVHVNVRPAPASRMDRRTAMTLSHEIGKQIQHSTSKLRSSPLTRGILHVGLHQPLKRVETPQSTPRKPDIVREAREPAAAERDAGESLMGLLNQVRQAKVAGRQPEPAAREPPSHAPAAHWQPASGPAAQRHWKSTQSFWDALTTEVDSAGRHARPQAPVEQQQVEKTTPRGTHIVDNEEYWRALDQNLQSTVPELTTASQQAAREAEQVRLDNDRLRKNIQAPSVHPLLAAMPAVTPTRQAIPSYPSPRHSTLHSYGQVPSSGWVVRRVDTPPRVLPGGILVSRPVR